MSLIFIQSSNKIGCSEFLYPEMDTKKTRFNTTIYGSQSVFSYWDPSPNIQPLNHYIIRVVEVYP